ncbi:MAG: hypothetical protein ABIK96_00185 [bacterium]
MLTRRNSQPSAADGTVLVTAPNLKDAYRKVRRDFGKDAVILDTRTVKRRHELGLGYEKLIQVTVQDEGSPRTAGTDRQIRALPGNARRPLAPSPHSSASTPDGDLPEAIIRELERIESLVRALDARLVEAETRPLAEDAGPMGEILLAAGARPRTVELLVQRFVSETGEDAADRSAFLEWLQKHLRAGNCDWEGFYGCHAFLGLSGADRQDLVLQTAARFQELGRKTLVLFLFPDNAGQVRQLQTEAARHGFDAAIVKKESLLEQTEKYLSQYDVVLMDLPDLDTEPMQPEGRIHNWLANNSGFHRHLVMGLDGDVDEMDPLAEASRHWNCDWLAITRTHRSRRRGKLLDMLESLPLPVSLMTGGQTGRQVPAIAQSGDLLDSLLEAGAGGQAGLVLMSAP